MSSYHRKPHSFVDYVQVKVSDLNRSLTFYRDMMGFKVLQHSENKVVLTANGTTPLVTIEQPDLVASKQGRTTGLYHFALLLPTRKDLGKLILHLLEAGYPLQGASNHGISEALYFADPDGNGIEVCVDTDPSTWKWVNGRLALMNNGPMDIKAVTAEAKGESWQGLPEGTLLGHIHLHVADLNKTSEFYKDGLGFDIVIEIPNQAVFFSSGGYHHHIGTNVWNGVGAPRPLTNSVGLAYYSIVLPNDEVRRATIERIKALGYQVAEEDGDIYTEDPSGNRMQLRVNILQ